MPEGRRRLAAIMFTDMVGFSALTQRDEPLALRMMEEQRAIVRPVVARFAGREVKTMGDGALVVFDSALDATECAVEFQRQLFERNRDVPGQRVDLRVGIHVGDVVHTENDVYGDAVNIAARIEPLAETGGICVSGPVFEQVQNKVPYAMQVVPGAHLKNIETPVAVYRLELPWTPPNLAEATPFTDRRDALDRLKGIAAALRAGHGATIAISGEAGVGKSRLAGEFAARAEKDGARVLRGRADRGPSAAPFTSWSEAVRDFAREAPNPLLYRACEECAVEVARLVPELKSRLGRAAEAPPGEESSESRFFDGLRRFLENLSREAPLVVVLDDAQWLGSASLRFVEHLGRRIADVPILVVLSYRDEPVTDLGPLLAVVAGLGAEGRLVPIALRPFDASASVDFLRQMLRGRLPPSGGDLAAPLYEKSGGNPMILEAMIRALVADGSLVWTDAGWAPKPGVELRLPPGIQEIVRERLAQLAPRTVELLGPAAVLGSQFSFDALRRVTGASAQELLPRLEEAVRARILEERPLGPGRSVYAFSHRSVVEALYEGIGLVRRTEYHARAAEVLEALATEGVEVPPGELAHQFLRANEPGKALEYTLLAAEAASRLFARDEAIRLYESAGALLASQPDDQRHAQVLFNVGDQMDILGRHSEAYRSMRAAAELYERLGLTTEAGAVHTGIARRISAHNEPVRALEHLERARRLLETGGPSVELARMYDAMGLVMFQEIRIPEARESWVKAIEVAGQVGALRVEATARMMLATILPPGENDRVWEYLETALALARKADARPVVPNVMGLQALALVQMRGDGRGALRVSDDAIAYARSGHDVLHEMFFQGNIVPFIHWRLGDLPKAEAAALGHRAFVAGDPHRERPTAIVVLAEVALARGEVERAEKLLWEVERLLAEGGDWSDNASAQTALAQCALARGRPLAAIEHLRTAHGLCRKAGPPAIDTLFLLETLAYLVRAHLDAGDPAEAERCLTELTELDRAFGEPLGRAFRLRAEAAARAARGDAPAAIAALQESAGLWKQLGWQYEWAQTLEELAGLCASSGESRRAASLREQALEFRSKVGAPAPPLPGVG